MTNYRSPDNAQDNTNDIVEANWLWRQKTALIQNNQKDKLHDVLNQLSINLRRKLGEGIKQITTEELVQDFLLTAEEYIKSLINKNWEDWIIEYAKYKKDTKTTVMGELLDREYIKYVAEKERWERYRPKTSLYLIHMMRKEAQSRPLLFVTQEGIDKVMVPKKTESKDPAFNKKFDTRLYKFEPYIEERIHRWDSIKEAIDIFIHEIEDEMSISNEEKLVFHTLWNPPSEKEKREEKEQKAFEKESRERLDEMESYIELERSQWVPTLEAIEAFIKEIKAKEIHVDEIAEERIKRYWFREKEDKGIFKEKFKEALPLLESKIKSGMPRDEAIESIIEKVRKEGINITLEDEKKFNTFADEVAEEAGNPSIK